MVKGGFTRKNAPKNKKDKTIPGDKIDWSFKLSNNDIRQITKTSKIKHFCHQIKSNKASSHASKCWKKFSNITEIDESQLRRIMIDHKKFMQLLSKVQKIMEAPDENNFSNREN